MGLESPVQPSPVSWQKLKGKREKVGIGSSSRLNKISTETLKSRKTLSTPLDAGLWELWMAVLYVDNTALTLPKSQRTQEYKLSFLNKLFYNTWLP